MRPENAFHRLLQLEQREQLRHQVEDGRARLDRAPQLRDGTGEHAGMMPKLRVPQGDTRLVARAITGKTRLAHQVVALDDLFLVPSAAVGPEGDTHAALPVEVGAAVRVAARARPRRQLILDGAQGLRLAVAEILPRKDVVPTHPIQVFAVLREIRRQQRQVAERHDRQLWLVRFCRTHWPRDHTLAERAQRPAVGDAQARGPLDRGRQPFFQRGMLARHVGAGRKGGDTRARARRHSDHRLVPAYGKRNRTQVEGHGLLGRRVQNARSGLGGVPRALDRTHRRVHEDLDCNQGLTG